MANAASIAHGPMMIGLCSNYILLGVCITQTYIYMITYSKRDNLWMRMFVAVMLLANIVNTVFLSVDLYHSLIDHFNDDEYLARATWLFATDPAMTGIISGAVQIFFAWRVKVLTSSWALSIGVTLLALTGTVSAIITSFEIQATPQFLDFQKFQTVVIIWLVSSCISDLAITTILVWFLRKHKTGFQGSDELVDRIIRMTVQTGLITSLCSIVDLVVFLVNPTGLHLIFNFPLCKLYTNTLLSSLNSRSGWAYSSGSNSGGLTTTVGGTTSERKKRTGGNMPSGMAGTSRSEVYVNVERHEMQDRSTTVPSFAITQAHDADDGDSSVWEQKQGGDVV